MGTSSLSNSSMFAGSSRYSTDFQQVIQRAVAIASLPLTQLQSGLVTLQGQSSELGTLSQKLTSLQSAVSAIGTATGSSSLEASTSDANVSASPGTGALPGTYTVQVTNLGSYNNTMSKDSLLKVTDPAIGNISAQSNFTLSADGKSYSFTATNLNDMVAEINQSGLAVQASLVNVSSPASPDYRLSIQGTKLGALGISLTDDVTPTPNQLLDTPATGAKAAYKVNGYGTEATSESRTVEIAPGLTITLAAKTKDGDPATTITVARDADSMKNSLSGLVNAYNAVVTEIDKNRGSGAGALAGQSILYTIDDVLSRVQSYAPGSGQFSSLEDLGVKIDQDGKMSFDASTFDKAVDGHTDDLMTFLGTAGTDGSGFLKAATDALASLEDPTTGAVSSAISLLSTQIDSQNDRISTEQDRIDDLQKRLNEQMAAADAAIAALEQQANYITSLFASMQSASDSYNK